MDENEIKQQIPLVYRFIFSRCQDKSTAEDLTQTVFLKFIQHSGQTHNYPKQFLYRIAKTTLIDWYRKKKEIYVDEIELFETHLTSPSPEHEFEKTETSSHLSLLLNQLEPESRTILEMRYLMELSYVEISRETGKSEMALRQIVSRALKKLDNEKYF